MYLKKKKTEREVKKKSIKNVSKPDTETKMERIDKTKIEKEMGRQQKLTEREKESKRD